jgi:chaperonin GroES
MIRPLEDRIVIKPVDPETKTASGIYLPESAKEKPMQGKVVAVGPGKLMDNGERIQPSVKKGDTVVYGKYAGTEIEIKNVKHMIVRESELLGVIEGRCVFQRAGTSSCRTPHDGIATLDSWKSHDSRHEDVPARSFADRYRELPCPPSR